MTLAQLQTKAFVFLGDLKDVSFSASAVTGTDVTVQVNGVTVLQHHYFADPDGNVHLDLREIVTNRTQIPLPAPVSPAVFSTAPYATASVTVTVGTNTTYSFTAAGYYDGLFSSLSEADYIRVPKNFRFLAYIPNAAVAFNSATAKTDIYVHDQIRRELFGSIEPTVATSRLLGLEFPVTKFASKLGAPFRLRFALNPSQTGYDDVYSPVYEMVNGDFEQYAFLNDLGSYENIPMSGDLKVTPELTFENAQHSSGFAKVQEDRQELYEQNTGYLTKATANALSKLLSSDSIYHLEDGIWVRILIESPEITISKMQSLQSFTFTWRHVEL